jgi:hypothetical protein
MLRITSGKNPEKKIPLKVLGVRDCIQKCPDWLPAERTANGTAFCH